MSKKDFAISMANIYVAIFFAINSIILTILKLSLRLKLSDIQGLLLLISVMILGSVIWIMTYKLTKE